MRVAARGALVRSSANKRDSLVARYGELALGLRAIASITTYKTSSQAAASVGSPCPKGLRRIMKIYVLI